MLALPVQLLSQTGRYKNGGIKVLPQQPGFNVGNLIGTTVPIDSFKLQKEITVSPGYTFKSADVYFSGANFLTVIKVSLDNASLGKINNLVSICVPGSTITFDSVKLIDQKGNEVIPASKTYLFYNGNFLRASKLSAAYAAFTELGKKDFISGLCIFQAAILQM